MNKKVGLVTSKSNLSQVVIEVTDLSLSMNEFLTIWHNQLNKEDIIYKEKYKKTKLLATLNILEKIPNPFHPDYRGKRALVVKRAENGKVADVLDIEEQLNHIHIGNLIGHDINVYLDPNSLILKHIGVLGKTGSGKTYTVGVIVEELIKLNLTSVIIDPHRDYSYMAVHYPQHIRVIKPSMLDCIHLDKLYLENKITVLDLLDIPSDEQPMYVNDIQWTLFEKAKANEIKSFLSIVDECHNFAPQLHKCDSSDIMATVSTEGRKFGMGLCAITQRPARISKNVLSQCNTHLILKVTNPRDVDAVMRSVEGIRKEDKQKIQMLDIGEALIIGSNIKMPQYVKIKKKLCGEKIGKKVI